MHVSTAMGSIYVSGFEKRDQFAQIADFEQVVLGGSTVDELFIALCCTSISAPIPEIRSLNVQKYARNLFIIISLNIATALLFFLV